MHTALRYLIFGALVASVVSLWSPPWWIMVIAFWAGSVLGLVTRFLVFWCDNLFKVGVNHGQENGVQTRDGYEESRYA